MLNAFMDGIAFGPVVESGVGVGYILQPDGVTLNVTSWVGKGPPAEQLATAIADALGKLRELADLPEPTRAAKVATTSAASKL